LTQEGAPVVARLIAQIASRFGTVVSEKVAVTEKTPAPASPSVIETSLAAITTVGFWVSTSRAILDFPGAQNVATPAEVLELDCEVLIPAALEHQITAANAPRIRAKIIAEAANGPVDNDADAILSERGVFMVPDIFLNAGGVTASYFEWVKNLSHISFARMTKRQQEISNRRIVEMVEQVTGRTISTPERQMLTEGPREVDFVYTALEETIAVAYQRIRSIWKQRALPDLRTACYVMAIEQVGNSYLSQGIFP